MGTQVSTPFSCMKQLSVWLVALTTFAAGVCAGVELPVDPAVRSAAYAAVQKKVHDAAVWIPLYHEPLFVVAGPKLKPIKAHGNYGCGLYKGLGIAFK